jgi:hypothetical protein
MEAAKGSRLTFGHASAGSVTNPFMVTAAFTIFFGVEFLFIRILALAAIHGARCRGIIDFCAPHNILHALHNATRQGASSSKATVQGKCANDPEL